MQFPATCGDPEATYTDQSTPCQAVPGRSFLTLASQLFSIAGVTLAQIKVQRSWHSRHPRSAVDGAF